MGMVHREHQPGCAELPKCVECCPQRPRAAQWAPTQSHTCPGVQQAGSHDWTLAPLCARSVDDGFPVVIYANITSFITLHYTLLCL